MQSKKLYVGNLSYSVSREDLEKLFSQYGEIVEAKLIQGKGFGFIEMSRQLEAEKAKETLNGSEFKGRTLRVSEARPSRERQKRGNRRF
ncbi:MAG: RNA-binding protein [Thermodesulfobacteriota bacterium]|nr:RNA-binding protein [Thermodesulfobacteriota bacterium]